MESTRKSTLQHILNNFHIIRNYLKTQLNNLPTERPITHSQWILLNLIDQAQTTNISSISQKLGISSSAITQLVDNLVQVGDVLRTPDPQDRRAVQLKLSTQGQTRLRQIKVHHLNQLEQMFDTLTDTELNQYNQFTQKLIAQINH